MVRPRISFLAVAVLAVALCGCDSLASRSAPDATPAPAATSAAPDASSAPETAPAAPTASSAAPQASSTGRGQSPSYEQVLAWVTAYKAAHPSNSDINAEPPRQVADPTAAGRLLSICGKDQRPIIPLLAWERGGNDHRWIDANRSALVYCVYTPVRESTDHWHYDDPRNKVTADVYVKYPDQNPCKDSPGVQQVADCIGAVSNYEILVDTASFNDGKHIGLQLSEATTLLKLILPNGQKVNLAKD